MPAPVRDPGRIPGQAFIPNVLALRLVWDLPDGKQAHNVLHAAYGTIPAIDQTYVDNLFSSVKTALVGSGLGIYLHADSKLRALGVRDMRQDPGTGFGYGEWLSAGDPLDGASTEPNPLPAQVAFVVTLHTGFSRQANRGRLYLTGFAADANDTAGKAVAAVGVDAVLFVGAVKTALAAGPFNLSMCIAHPARQAYTSARTGNSYPARAAGHVNVTNITARDLNWDSQRLRNLR